jgi:isoquinoline 1-oxidoreductase subunit beta
MASISSAPKLSRRTFVKATAAAGGALVLSLSFFRLNTVLAAESNADFAPNAFVRIDTDGMVTFTIPQVEMGQGIYTALSMILAEELDAPFEHVTAVAAPPNDKLYANPLLGFQVTGGSTSVRAFWDPMRVAGARARAMLVEAAAAKWSVAPASCRTENGEVLHDASAQKAAYGELVRAAAALTPPQNPPLKPAADFKLIGKSLKRLDTPDKVNGKAVYGIDALPPGVKIATLASCPVFGGKVAHVNDERTKTVPGVRQVIVLDDLVAVVGDHMWAAKKGLAALDITWDEGPNAAVSTADVLNGLVAAGEKAGVVAKTTGDIDKALGEGTKL